MKQAFAVFGILVCAVMIRAQEWKATEHIYNPVGGSGSSTDIDGNIAVVGGPWDGDHGNAYIYYKELLSEKWNHIATLNSDEISYNSEFGFSVAISGNYVIVGAPREEEPLYNEATGAVYIFHKDKNGTDSWGKVARFQPADAVPVDNELGRTVSISGDYALAGEVGQDNRAFLFYKDQGGTDQWEPLDTLEPSAGLGMIGSLSIDGDYAVICDVRADVDTGTGPFRAGAGYIFYKNQGGPGAWGETVTVSASDPYLNDAFGSSSELTGDYLAIGAPDHDYDREGGNYLVGAGAAYLFGKNQGGTGQWGQITKLTAPDREELDKFGNSITVSGDYIVAGAYREDEDESGEDSLNNSGSAYIFFKDQDSPGAWGELQKIVAHIRAYNDYFGTSVSMTENHILAGTDNSSSYFFRNYIQAYGIGFGMIKHDMFGVVFSPGNGDGRSVFIKEGIGGTAKPEDYADYIADSVFGMGDQIGTSGWYCAYNGTGNTANIYGLTMNHDYTIMVCEYILHGSTTNKIYDTKTALSNPVTQSFLIDLSSVETGVVDGLLQNTTLKMQFSQNTTNGADGDWYDCSEGNTLIDYVPGVVYIRQKTIPSHFRHVRDLEAPANLAKPGFTINYPAESTAENVDSNIEYNLDNMFDTPNETGTGAKISLNPGLTYYFRYMATDTSFASLSQSLPVPDRPAAPSFSVNYTAEQTSGPVAEIYEYSISPDMSGATAGIYVAVTLTPGTDLYLRKISTASSFSGYIQHLVVPERPPVPVVSLSDKNSSKATFMKSIDGTGERVTNADSYAYSTDNGSTWYPILDATIIDASGNKHIIARQNPTDSSFKSLSTTNLDSDKPIAEMISTRGCSGPGESIEAKTNIDNGYLYIILDGEPVSSLSDLEAAITLSKGSKTEITAASTPLAVSTEGLVEGNYFAFALNTLDSLSDKSSTAASLYQNPLVDLGNDITKCKETVVTLDAGPGFSAYLWSHSGDTARSIQITEEGDYAVTVTDNHGCKDSDTLAVRFNIPYQEEEICIVTIDPATSRNIIVWEKTPDSGIIEYNIYRESKVGLYVNIGTIGVNELSVFIDETGEPWKQPYLYKITAVDSCGIESLRANSRFHKPSFLQYVSAVGGINLEWTDYQIEGIDNIGMFLDSYSIYRGVDSIGLSEYAVVGSINNFTDSDPNAFTKRYYYRVAANFKDFCIPSAGKKLDEETYGRSLSNLENNRISTSKVQITRGSSGILIYPNPSEEAVKIEILNEEFDEYSINLKDLSGRTHRLINNITSRKVTIERGNLPAGIYFIEVKGDQVWQEKIIIQ